MDPIDLRVVASSVAVLSGDRYDQIVAQIMDGGPQSECLQGDQAPYPDPALAGRPGACLAAITVTDVVTTFTKEEQ